MATPPTGIAVAPNAPLNTGASLPTRVICPFCGGSTATGARCEHCRGLLDPLSRQATQNEMGPWFIRDETGPFRPGCSYETLIEFIRRGKVGPDTVLRGPTTRQFWAPARRVPAIANWMGLCHNCGGSVRTIDGSCGSCGASFQHEPERNVLGLAPVHLLPRQATPEQIAAFSRRIEPAPARRRSVDQGTPEPVMTAETEMIGPRRRSSLAWAITASALAGVFMLVLVLTAVEARTGPSLGLARLVLGGERPRSETAPQPSPPTENGVKDQAAELASPAPSAAAPTSVPTDLAESGEAAAQTAGVDPLLQQRVDGLVKQLESGTLATVEAAAGELRKIEYDHIPNIQELREVAAQRISLLKLSTIP